MKSTNQNTEANNSTVVVFEKPARFNNRVAKAKSIVAVGPVFIKTTDVVIPVSAYANITIEPQVSDVMLEIVALLNEGFDDAVRMQELKDNEVQEQHDMVVPDYVQFDEPLATGNVDSAGRMEFIFSYPLDINNEFTGLSVDDCATINNEFLEVLGKSADSSKPSAQIKVDQKPKDQSKKDVAKSAPKVCIPAFASTQANEYLTQYLGKKPKGITPDRWTTIVLGVYYATVQISGTKEIPMGTNDAKLWSRTEKSHVILVNGFDVTSFESKEKAELVFEVFTHING